MKSARAAALLVPKVLGFTRRGWNAFDGDARRTSKLFDAVCYDLFILNHGLRPGQALAKLREEKQEEDREGSGTVRGRRRRPIGGHVEMDDRNPLRRIEEGRTG